MARHTAISVDNDLPSRKPAVAHWATNDELTGGVDVILGVIREPLARKHCLNDLAFHKGPERFLFNVRGVLCGQNNCVYRHGLAAFVAH